ncbi:MFS transporter [Pigmentiphaga litoralis]|uniref:Putative MFS family arabinose efflux permease n=1 Tax=Pigmentiphaga litoralis TaxID=516702 RepID=A0A7Y9IYR1_9BURK|nr:MFS transporter [Pigmentiphaga litoralis]NYE26482.1 putative MFS family arabinose efflux permease [Pigmentiphaga litoralis]NYE85602.1 putative MFS family arabinose efflux permease [Pigmentiphaga litoralis]
MTPSTATHHAGPEPTTAPLAAASSPSATATATPWAAVGSMAMCVALLIASEFMPVSLLTPIATDLHATQGMAGQAISVSGLFAVVTSLFIATIASRFDRRHVLLALTVVMLASLLLIASATNFAVFMAARALLGITVGGFWALSTATIMRLVPDAAVPKALGLLYTGNAVAAAFAAPIGSYVGGLIGWRGVFWAMTPFVVANLIWQWASLPSLPPQAATPVRKVLGLLKRPHVAFAMLGVMLTFAGAFASFTYFRPFLETTTGVTVTQLSLLLLCLGAAGFLGTYSASMLIGRHLYALMRWLPLALAAVTLAMLVAGHWLWAVGGLMVAWGTLNSAIPVCWSTWLSKGVADDPESGGGLMVAAIQLAIMLGGGLGGLLLDGMSITATFVGSAVLLVAASVSVGNGKRIRPAE